MTFSGRPRQSPRSQAAIPTRPRSRSPPAEGASILSAHTAEEIICVVSVPAVTGLEAAAVALAIVADALKAAPEAAPSPSR